MPRINVAFGLIGGFALFANAKGQELVREQMGPAAGGQFGGAVTALSDLDGDGVSEYAIGDAGAGFHSGTVEVFSGATGALRLTIAGSGSGTFGNSIRDAGDADGDGIADLLVGDCGFDDPNQSYVLEGAVRVYSGADGALIQEFVGAADYNDFGAAVDRLDDIDGDAIPDLIVLENVDPGDTNQYRATAIAGGDGSVIYVINLQYGVSALCAGVDRDGDGVRDLLIGGAGSPAGADGGPAPGTLHSFSGATGAEILEMAAAAHSTLVEVGDLDGDGQREVLAGFRYYDDGGAGFTGGSYRYSVDVHSLATGTTFHSHSFLGWLCTGLGDADGDGVDDYLISGGDAPSAVVVSGRSGETLYAVAPDVTGPSAGLGDLNGDGHPDFIVGAPGFVDSNGVQRGRARVYSGNDFWLNADPKSVVQDDYEVLASRGVPAGHLVGVAIVDVNGSPLFQFLALGAADATEALILENNVPPGLAGLTVTFQSFAIGRMGRVIDSAPETIVFL